MTMQKCELTLGINQLACCASAGIEAQRARVTRELRANECLVASDPYLYNLAPLLNANSNRKG